MPDSRDTKAAADAGDGGQTPSSGVRSQARSESLPRKESDPRPRDASVSEDEESREPEAGPQDDSKKQDEPEDELAALKRERDEYLELAQRAQADFENYRKRAAREAAAAGERAKTGLLREFLPVVDNLERALAAAPDQDDGLAKGVRLVLDELVGVFQRSGIEAIEPEGDAFDPTFHEALSTRSEDGAKPGVVLEVVEKGYKLSDTVIRPARVVVSA